MSSKLQRRRFGDVVGSRSPPARMTNWCGVSRRGWVSAKGTPTDRGAPRPLRALGTRLVDRPELKFAPWEPVTPAAFASSTDDLLRGDPRGPTSSSSIRITPSPATVEKFLDAAAKARTRWRSRPPSTAPTNAHRSGRRSSAAAEAGKQAVSLVELKARFDERAQHRMGPRARARRRARRLRLPGFKIHAKLTLVVTATKTASADTPTSAPATTTRSPPGSTRTSDSSPPTPRSPPTSPTSSTTSPGSATNPTSANSSSRPGSFATNRRRDRPGRQSRRLGAAGADPDQAERPRRRGRHRRPLRRLRPGARIEVVARGICCLRPASRG